MTAAVAVVVVGGGESRNVRVALMRRAERGRSRREIEHGLVRYSFDSKAQKRKRPPARALALAQHEP